MSDRERSVPVRPVVLSMPALRRLLVAVRESFEAATAAPRDQALTRVAEEAALLGRHACPPHRHLMLPGVLLALHAALARRDAGVARLLVELVAELTAGPK